MLRMQPCLRSRHVCSFIRSNQKSRQLSSTSGQKGGGAGKALAIIGASTVAATAGVVGYGASSNESRKFVEDTFPGSSYLLNLILGPSFTDFAIPPIQNKPKPIPKMLNDSAPPVKFKKEKSPPKIEEPIVPESVEPSPENNLILTPLEINEAPVEPQEIIIVTPSAEEKELARISEQLNELQKAVNSSISDAISTAEAAADAIRVHAEQAFKAIDSADEKQFVSVSEFADKKAELIKAADEKIDAILAKIDGLKEGISSALESTVAKGNKEIVAAEEAIADYMYSISNIKNTITEAINDSKAVGEYGELVDAGRKQFAAEIRSLMPDVKLGETSEKLTTDELNLLLAHAHQKVINLQRLVAKHQVLEHESVKQAIDVQRKEEASLLESKIQAELEKQQHILNLQHKQDVEKIKEDFESEMLSQLKRQAAAHSDHLSDVLSVQEKELENKWQTKLIEEVQNERDQYHREVAEMRGHVDGLGEALQMRANIDKQAFAARELWLACEALKEALNDGGDLEKSLEENLKPLNNLVKAIETASGDNVFVKAAVSAVPQEVLDRGVYTESALKERFIKVEKVAKKLSLVGDNGGSLVRYLLSYLHDMFLVNTFDSVSLEEKKNQEVLVDELTTHDILARVRYCLDTGDLVQAVKYMNLLRGEPRHVSSEWLKEARLNLETRLIADALVAHAAATTIKAI